MQASFQAIQPNTTIQASSQQPIAMKEGQVFHGTIKQLHPNQTAEIQVGNQKMIAKLEVPLKAGDSHFFQVTGTTPQTELKVVTGPMGPAMTQSQQMNQLLETMNLPKSADMQRVLSHFMKEQLPISKDQLIQAEAWMKNLSGPEKQQALTALQKMVDLKMPFTEEVFKALIAGQKTSGMTSTLDQFAKLLQADKSLAPEVRQNMLAQLQSLAKPFDSETGGQMLAKMVQTLQGNGSMADKLQALQFLKEAGVLPKSATLANWSTPQATANTGATPLATATPQQPASAGQVIQSIMQTKPADASALMTQLKDWVGNNASLTSTQKTQLGQLIERFSQLPANNQTLQAFAKEMQSQLVKAFSANTAGQMFSQDAAGMSAKEQLVSLLQPNSNASAEAMLRQITQASIKSPLPLTQNALTTVEAQVQNGMDGKAMEHALKTVLKGMGISYEAALNHKSSDTHALAQQVKPQLQAMLDGSTLSPQLREAGEMLMSRMNGMQLMSGENGPQHQLVMQVPLEFLGRKMDATLQWNGRMKKDGKIDSSYARILFYLNMQSLQETVIDMQVQNRVVTVTVFNDHPELKVIAPSFEGALKEGLADKDYQLSAVFVKTFEQRNQPKKAVKPSGTNEAATGVDYRV